MVHVYITENIKKFGGKDNFVKTVLLRHTAAPITILREKDGKPYLENNPVYFNVTHSGNYCAVAVSGSPVGVDMEVYNKGIRKAVLSSYTAAEQAEITIEKQFLAHWTAREAYIKYLGGTLAGMLKFLEYTDGILRYDGSTATPQPQFYYADNFVLAICSVDETDKNISYAVL